MKQTLGDTARVWKRAAKERMPSLSGYDLIAGRKSGENGTKLEGAMRKKEMKRK